MRIQATERSRQTCPSGRRPPVRSSGGFGFLQELSGPARGANAATGSQGAAALCGPAGLLMAQEVDMTSLSRRRAKRRAEALLDQLETLRHDILLGSVPESTLTELTHLVESERAVVDDPQLVSILDAIDLRARVELAKLEVARERAAKVKGRLHANSIAAE